MNIDRAVFAFAGMMILASLAYVAIIFISVYAARHLAPPRWVAILLAASWMSYGFVKRRVRLDAVTSLAGVAREVTLCDVGAYAPLRWARALALLARRSPRVHAHVVRALALGIAAAGAYWFVSRVLASY